MSDEQQDFKVVDRRPFNPDGTPRELPRKEQPDEARPSSAPSATTPGRESAAGAVGPSSTPQAGERTARVITGTGTESRLTAKAFHDFSGAVASTLQNNTYLERKDGKHVFLIDYRAPIQDGLGAKFVFPRTVDGQPFLTSDSGEVRFVSEVGPDTKLNRPFKVSSMIYQGKLEY